MKFTCCVSAKIARCFDFIEINFPFNFPFIKINFPFNFSTYVDWKQDTSICTSNRVKKKKKKKKNTRNFAGRMWVRDVKSLIRSSLEAASNRAGPNYYVANAARKTPGLFSRRDLFRNSSSNLIGSQHGKGVVALSTFLSSRDRNLRQLSSSFLATTSGDDNSGTGNQPTRRRIYLARRP